ncbi:11771_t:CDS:2 [Scutellospora calospora]|uniref:11771_t:CDS:1 n=1 Tax=Scutellospora calospora TaxID=85575 RepID=A0ACA9LND5_9GLOM|nr:11771_t:CDS:2 [Scutellospora calospora]
MESFHFQKQSQKPYIDLAVKGNDMESFHFQSGRPHAINQARQKLEENLESIQELS